MASTLSETFVQYLNAFTCIC